MRGERASGGKKRSKRAVSALHPLKASSTHPPAPRPSPHHTPTHSYTTTPQPKPATATSPNPFGFRRFKGHKHDREAAARRAATAAALESMPQRIADHRASRRAVVTGASPIDQLLSRPKELRLKAGRGVAPGPPKK